MSREIHVRFCERLGVKTPGATHQFHSFHSLLTYMTRSTVFRFESSAFEDHATYSETRDKALAHWLSDLLQADGFDAGDLMAEHSGWCIPVKSKSHSLYVVCTNIERSKTHWQVHIFSESGLLTRLLGNERRSELLSSLVTAVRRCLQRAPEVRGLREEAV